eukprot:3145080-Pleurochrysis_carterae.AAC.2
MKASSAVARAPRTGPSATPALDSQMPAQAAGTPRSARKGRRRASMGHGDTRGWERARAAAGRASAQAPWQELT